jgi:Resolvase, N terminal domain
MKYGYARVSTDGQSVAAQVAALKAAGSGTVFREVASGAKTDRAQLRRAIAALEAGDVLMVTCFCRGQTADSRRSSRDRFATRWVSAGCGISRDKSGYQAESAAACSLRRAAIAAADLA